MREYQDPADAVTDAHQMITWMTVGIAVFLVAALFALSDEPKPFHKGLMWFSLAGLLIELAIACRIWLIWS